MRTTDKNIFEKLIQSLQLLAADYNVQKESLPDFVHVPDEVILTFNEAFMCIDQLFDDNLITKKQKDELSKLDRFLSKFDKFGAYPSALKSLESSQEWKDIRKKSLEILKSLGYKKEKPNLFWVQYVEGKKNET